MPKERKYYGQGHKSFIFEGCKVLDEGNGRLTGYGSLLYTPDRGAEIIIGYDDVDEFVKSGFMSDTHGRRSGELGKHTMSDTIGLIEDAKVDSKGLWVDAAFHSDQPSQDIRTKVRERMDKKKDVPLSIGYKITQPPIYVYRSDYLKELARFIPKEHLAECLEGCKAYSQVKLIRVAPFEISTVPRAMHQGALAEGAKSDMSKIQITKDGFKAEFLGENIESQISWNAVCTIMDRLRWFCFDCCYSNEEDWLEKMRAAWEEACDICCALCERIRSEEGKDAGMDAMKAFISTKFEFKAGHVPVIDKLLESVAPKEQPIAEASQEDVTAAYARHLQQEHMYNQIENEA